MFWSTPWTQIIMPLRAPCQTRPVKSGIGRRCLGISVVERGKPPEKAAAARIGRPTFSHTVVRVAFNASDFAVFPELTVIVPGAS